MPEIKLVNVFTHRGAGGNPCPVVIDARALPEQDMQAVAKHFGHESGFVLPAANGDADYIFRFWVPRHEMEMCGHATIGALSAGPNSVPAWINPTAKPRSELGAQSRTAR